MKKKMVLFLMAITVIASSMMVSSCLSMFGVKTADFDTFLDTDVSVMEHSVVTIPEKLQVTAIDGEAGVISAGNKTVLLMLPPGEHTFSVSYFSASLNYYNGGKSYSLSQTSSNIVQLTDTFLPGHFYYMDYTITGGNILLDLIDETDPAVYEKKGDQQAAQKRNEAAKKKLIAVSNSPKASVVISREPTKFEGTWNSGPFTYVFAGNTFVRSAKINDVTVTVKGTFEFTDDKFTFIYKLMGRQDANYAFNPDGSFYLLGAGDQKIMFTKAEE
jgi:hypothetical protein